MAGPSQLGGGTVSNPGRPSFVRPGRASLGFLPSILFEGDLPSVADAPSAGAVAGVARPVAPRGLLDVEGARRASAPASAGLVDDVWLQPRDPMGWVAHWSANPAHRAAAEETLGRGRWWVRLREASEGGRVVAERPAAEHEGSAVVHVDDPCRRYVAELGYDSFQSGWHPIVSTVSPALPVESVTAADAEPVVPRAPQGAVSLPGPTPLAAEHSAAPVAGAREDDAPPTPSAEVRRTWEAWKAGDRGDSSAWADGGGNLVETAAERAMRAAMNGRGEGRGPTDGVSSGAWVAPGSLVAGPGAFRFAVNVEVIVHGSTEPDARVTLGGRPVALRPDGSFSVRWLLPDGDFRVPAAAVAADGRERREVRLRLMRGTATPGRVGTHALEPGANDPISGWAG